MKENNNLKEMGRGVYYTTDKIAKLSKNDIDFLKERMFNDNLQRIRICSHKDINDKVHEMFIVLRNTSYIRPHKHLNKSESFHLVEGKAKIIIFDDKGNIQDLIDIDAYDSEKKFYYRISNAYYHTVLVASDFLVFHETIQGPFKKEYTVFAPWAPEENDGKRIKEYLKKLVNNIDKFLSENR